MWCIGIAHEAFNSFIISMQTLLWLFQSIQELFCAKKRWNFLNQFWCHNEIIHLILICIFWGRREVFPRYGCICHNKCLFMTSANASINNSSCINSAIIDIVLGTPKWKLSENLRKIAFVRILFVFIKSTWQKHFHVEILSRKIEKMREISLRWKSVDVRLSGPKNSAFIHFLGFGAISWIVLVIVSSALGRFIFHITLD